MKHHTQPPSVRPPVSRGKRRGLRRINPDAAGIDIGSTEHYVAVPEDRDSNPVRVFGCLTPDLHEMAKWLQSCGIKTAKPRKNQVHFDLKSELIRLNGVDLTAIDGIDTLTAQTLLAECGRDTAAFPTEKHFAS